MMNAHRKVPYSSPIERRFQIALGIFQRTCNNSALKLQIDMSAQVAMIKLY
jgi:hypothetical protein